MENYRDKVVVITGSAGGIGFALAKQFLADSARLVLSDLPGDRLDAAVSELQAQGGEVIGIPCDVSRREDVEALAEKTVQHYGAVDVLVNNAGISQQPVPLLDADLADFRQLFEVNVYGVLNGIQVFGNLFREQGTPSAIYNLGSENSIYPCVPSAHAYVASKHVVLAISELLAEETPDFIEVALIMPGFVISEMTRGFPQGMDADEFAATVMAQLKAGEFYIVSHAYNRVRLEERFSAIAAAYDKYAPRYSGDDEYDVRTLIAKLS
jgi:NAD(P)-dependent dehydrogenase (short-subunit alcohol dehydrogenase family)